MEVGSAWTSSSVLLLNWWEAPSGFGQLWLSVCQVRTYINRGAGSELGELVSWSVGAFSGALNIELLRCVHAWTVGEFGPLGFCRGSHLSCQDSDEVVASLENISCRRSRHWRGLFSVIEVWDGCLATRSVTKQEVGRKGQHDG